MCQNVHAELGFLTSLDHQSLVDPVGSSRKDLRKDDVKECSIVPMSCYVLMLFSRSSYKHFGRLVDMFCTAALLLQEKLAYVALDFDQECRECVNSSSHERSYELPDGAIIALASERFRCAEVESPNLEKNGKPNRWQNLKRGALWFAVVACCNPSRAEVLFKPHLIGKEANGIHELVFQSIAKSDCDLRRELYANVVLSGGTTILPGLGERMARELTALAPATVRIKVRMHLRTFHGSPGM
eukprot:5125811-Amphidinium_carterae.1